MRYSVGGSATPGDYEENLSGEIVFDAGQLTTSLKITPVSNGKADGDRTLEIQLLNGPNYKSDANKNLAKVKIEEWQQAAISSVVFIDKNGNGIKDVGEQGVFGEKVALFEVKGGVPVPVLGADGKALETSTDPAGGYSFPNLDPAKQYVVQFVSNNVTQGLIVTTPGISLNATKTRSLRADFAQTWTAREYDQPRAHKSAKRSGCIYRS